MDPELRLSPVPHLGQPVPDGQGLEIFSGLPGVGVGQGQVGDSGPATSRPYVPFVPTAPSRHTRETHTSQEI